MGGDHPADRVATEDVGDRVEAVVDTLDRPLQLRDLPAPRVRLRPYGRRRERRSGRPCPAAAATSRSTTDTAPPAAAEHPCPSCPTSRTSARILALHSAAYRRGPVDGLPPGIRGPVVIRAGHPGTILLALDSINHPVCPTRPTLTEREANARGGGPGRGQRTMGDHAGAAEQMGQALDLFRILDDRLGEANTLQDLGRTRTQLRNYAVATDLLARSRMLFEEIGDSLGWGGDAEQHGRPSHEVRHSTAGARQLPTGSPPGASGSQPSQRGTLPGRNRPLRSTHRHAGRNCEPPRSRVRLPAHRRRRRDTRRQRVPGQSGSWAGLVSGVSQPRGYEGLPFGSRGARGSGHATPPLP